MSVKINLKSVNGNPRGSIDVEITDKIEDHSLEIYKIFDCQCAKMICNGRMLKLTETFEKNGIIKTENIVVIPAKISTNVGATPTTATTVSTAAATTATTVAAAATAATVATATTTTVAAATTVAAPIRTLPSTSTAIPAARNIYNPYSASYGPQNVQSFSYSDIQW
jgi:hypothetical protein